MSIDTALDFVLRSFRTRDTSMLNTAATVLAKEVERLRAELATMTKEAQCAVAVLEDAGRFQMAERLRKALEGGAS